MNAPVESLVPTCSVAAPLNARPYRARIEMRERSLAGFGPTCWGQQTLPSSHFAHGTVCSRRTGDGRISLSGQTPIRTGGAARTEEKLPDDDAVLAAYRDHFGIVLDRVPRAPARQPAHSAARLSIRPRVCGRSRTTSAAG